MPPAPTPHSSSASTSQSRTETRWSCYPSPDVLHIGRSMAAGLTLDDATVSRRHALIVHDERGTHVLDDRSLNGLVVRGRRVSAATLRDGDVIELGRVRLHYLRRT